MHAFVRLAIVPVLVLTLGLHWALLQTVAWTGMIMTYSQANPLREAVRMTFDGQHPCTMCKAINQGRAEEKQQKKLAPLTKLPLAVIWQSPFFWFDGERQLISSSNSACPTRTEAPPKPRPKPLPRLSLA